MKRIYKEKPITMKKLVAESLNEYGYSDEAYDFSERMVELEDELQEKSQEMWEEWEVKSGSLWEEVGSPEDWWEVYKEFPMESIAMKDELEGILANL